MKSSFTNEISPNLEKLVKELPALYKKAVGVVSLSIAEDAGYQNPTPPKDTGLLRGSWFAYAQGSKVGQGKDADVPSSIKNPKGKIRAVVGYAVPYAQKLHENLTPAGALNLGPGSVQAGDVGPYWLSSKLAKNKDKYNKLFEKRFKGYMGKL